MYALTLQGGTCMSSVPDVCKTPSPAGPVPVPYVNTFMCAAVLPGTACSKVTIAGAPALTVQSKTAMSSGDEPGTAGGVVSASFIGEGAFISGSAKVRLQGKAAVSVGALTSHNANNTTGMSVAPGQTKVMVL